MASETVIPNNKDYLTGIPVKGYLYAIILIAAILRFWGIWNGYPYSYYGDEIHFVKRALSFGSGDLNPHWFHKPALFMYILFFEYGVFFVIGKMASLWNSVAEYAVFYINNPGPFYLIGRITVAIFSLGSVILTWMLSKRHFGTVAAVIASFSMAISFGAIISSKNVKADAPCAFFTLLSSYYLLRYLEDQKNPRVVRYLSIASIAAGIGTAVKIYSMLMIVPIAAVVLLLNEGTILFRAKRLLFQAVLLITTYFICSPFNIIDPHGRISTFSVFIKTWQKATHFIFGAETDQLAEASREVQNIDHSFWDFIPGTIDYLEKLSIGLNLAILLLCAIGLFFVIRRRNRSGMVLFIYPVVFMSASIFLSPGYADLRHQLPMLPFIAIMAGISVQWISKNKIAAWAAILLYVFFSANDIARIAEYNMLLSKPDVRNVSLNWIENNIPSGTKVLLGENGPCLRKKPEQLHQEVNKAGQHPSGPFTTHYDQYLNYQIAANHEKVSYEIFEIRVPWWRNEFKLEGLHNLDSDFDADMGNPVKQVGVFAYDQYIDLKYEYAIIDSLDYNSFFDSKTKSELFPYYSRLYRDIIDKGEKVKSFSGMVPGSHPGKFVHMIVDIYKLH